MSVTTCTGRSTSTCRRVATGASNAIPRKRTPVRRPSLESARAVKEHALLASNWAGVTCYDGFIRPNRSPIMNYERYPWLRCISDDSTAGNTTAPKSPAEHSHLRDEAKERIQAAREQHLSTGAVTFPQFISPSALSSILSNCCAAKEGAFTTDDKHTPHQLDIDPSFDPPNSIRNFQMRTQVASIAYDELPKESKLVSLYRNPTLLALVKAITGGDDGETLYLSEDPIGVCTINVFRPSYGCWVMSPQLSGKIRSCEAEAVSSPPASALLNGSN